MASTSKTEWNVERIRRNPLLLTALCLAQFMVVLDLAVANIALPAIQQSLGVGTKDSQWVVIAYELTLAGCLLLGGRLADLVGRRRMLLVGVVVFAASSLGCGLSQTIQVLIAFRGLQGFGAALMAPAALSSLTSAFSEGHDRNRALGVWGAVGASGGAVGVILGGSLTSAFGWHWIFFLNVPVSLLVIVMVLVAVPESHGELRHRHFDLAGALTVTFGFLLTIYAVNRAVEQSVTATVTLVCAVAGIGLLLAFVVIERSAKAPLMDFSIFHNRPVLVANTVGILVFGSIFAELFLLSLYMQLVLGYSALKAGFAYLPLALLVIVASTLASGVTTRFGPKIVLGLGMTCAAVGMLLFARAPTTASYLADLLPGFVVAAFGAGLSVVPLQVAALSGVTEEKAGMGAGMISTAQELGGAIVVAVVGLVSASATKRYITHFHGNPAHALVPALAHGFHLGFVIGAALAILAVVLVVLFLPAQLAHPPANAHHTTRPFGFKAIHAHRSRYWGTEP